MPARSQKQQMMMAIAKHHPEELKPENKGVLKMTQAQMHDYAATDKKGLPVKVKKETKKTTTIKHDDSGPKADKSQRKQIKELT